MDIYTALRLRIGILDMQAGELTLDVMVLVGSLRALEVRC